MAISKQERINIEKLVVAMYNACLDRGYLDELSAAYEGNGRSLQQLATQLSLNSSFQTLHPTNQTASQFASTFLTPYGLQADGEATLFVKSKFDAGLNKGQIAYEAALALDNYTGNSAAINAAKAIQNNKAEVSEYYAFTRSIPNPSITILREFVAPGHRRSCMNYSLSLIRHAPISELCCHSCNEGIHQREVMRLNCRLVIRALTQHSRLQSYS